MQHVRKSFRVHQAVLDSNFQHRGQLRVALGGPTERLGDRLIELVAQALVVGFDFLTRRPI